MNLSRISRGLARMPVRRMNVLCAFVGCPVLLLLLLVSSVDYNQYTLNTTQVKEVMRETDFMFDIAGQQNYKQSPEAPSGTQSQRVARIQQVCQKMDVPGTVKGLYLYNNVSYCYSYKVASTYWIQVYRYLHHDVTKNVTKPSQISKYEAHLVQTKHIRLRYLFSLTDHDEILSSFRFMMVRDPYSRLWSVFVDKFILLDHYFWSRYSPEMRRWHFHPEAINDDVYTTKKTTIQCLDITFTEFLNYIAKKGRLKPENLDDHMRPIHYGCNPCFYSPNYIGKVEAMINEKKPIIQKLGLNTEYDIDDFKSHVVNEITMISDFQFKLWKSFKKDHVKCLTDISLEKKMIQAFIINGYLPQNVWKTFHRLLPLGEEKFKFKVIDTFLKSFGNSSVVREQRNRIRREAYRDVPISILKKIRRLFRYDFALFDYESTPGYIFSNRDSDVNNNERLWFHKAHTL